MSTWPTITESLPVPPEARQHFVRMRDGIRLATDVYLPEGPGPHPTILIRMPYDKNSIDMFMSVIARCATSAGYVAVIQDVRGKFRSEGEALGPVNEVHDGYDTLSWIAASEWSDGKVGMFGDSYYGYTQFAAVSSGHPALCAIVPRVTSTTLANFDLIAGDGVVDIPWITGATYQKQCWSGRYLNGAEPDLSIRPLTQAYDAMFDGEGERSPWFDTTVPHTHPGKVFPEGHPWKARAVPMLQCVGWWDNLALAQMRDVEAFAAVPAWDAVQHLWLDSIDHENLKFDDVGQIDWDELHGDNESLLSMMDIYLAPALKFFDVYVKGVGSPQDIPKVRWHLAHEGYREDAAWPPPGAHTAPLFLSDFNSMSATGGTLSATAPGTAERGELHFSPDNLVPSPIKNTWAVLAEYPDEQSATTHADVAFFETDAYAKNLDLAGPVYLWARISSTAPTADVFARLLDVAPDGTAHMILRGQAEFTAPDDATLRRIELGHTGYRVRPGHKLRLQLASSDFPEFVPNPGTGENRWTATEFKEATHTLTSDSISPARLDLTVLG